MVWGPQNPLKSFEIAFLDLDPPLSIQFTPNNSRAQ